MRTKQPTGKRKKTPQTQIPDFFTTLCKTTLGVDCVREFRFHPERKWRFDYAIPDHKVAIEIDGGVWQYGRHNRATGYLADLEKFNAAAALGWVVLKFTPQQQYKSSTLRIIGDTINTIRHEREPREMGDDKETPGLPGQ